MSYRNGNYSAFYVREPFCANNLGASATKDFVSYNLLKAWKAQENSFPFVDSHEKNYNVRDTSDWEMTLKPRIHDRLNKSKNIILFLSSSTKNSKALHEELEFGISKKGLPVIVVYPEYCVKSDIKNINSKTIKQQIINIWDNLSVFKNLMTEVPTIHIPNSKELIAKTLRDPDFMVGTKCETEVYFYG